MNLLTKLMKQDDTETEVNRVSVTWKWLAVTLVTVLVAAGGCDRLQMSEGIKQNRLDIQQLRERITVSPTREDVRELRTSIDKLTDKIDNVRDQVRGGVTR